MKILIADKLSAKAVGDLEALGATVVVKPELTADELSGVLESVEVLIVRSTKVKAPAIEAAGDLSLIIRENWAELGPKLRGKLHLYAGDMDNAYLNLAVVLLEDFLKQTTNPPYDGVVRYGNGEGHCWMPRREELFRLFREHIIRYTPKGMETASWNY